MSGYIGSTPVPQATQHRETFTATSGQTTFATAGYTAGFVDVYLNGSHLSPADFVATNGSDVLLVSGAAADDVCDIISYSAFEVNSQTFTGDFTVDGTTLVVDSTNNRVGVGTGVPIHALDVNAIATGAIPTNADIGASNANQNYFGFHNSSNSATFSGLALETRTSGAARWLIANEWQATYLGDLVFRVRDGGTSSSEVMRINSAGAITKPLQPAFLVQPASQQNNLAGTGATINFATERFDQNADWNVQTFAAPVTGKYQFNLNLVLLGVDADINYYQVRLQTSNRNYFYEFDPDFGQDPERWTVSYSALVDMDKDDTTTVVMSFSPDNVSSTVDVATSSDFSGFLVC